MNFKESSKFKNSKQRDKIIKLLQSTDSHPNADWIYARLKPEIPSLSLGTVYRNLRILLEQGKIQRLETGSGYDRYDARLAPHYHFTCKVCNEITDLFIEQDKFLNQQIAEMIGGQVDGHKVEFIGICKNCLSK